MQLEMSAGSVQLEMRCPLGTHVAITRDSGVCGHRAQEKGLDCKSSLKPSHALGNESIEKGYDGLRREQKSASECQQRAKET